MITSVELVSLNIGKPKQIKANDTEFISSVGRSKVTKAFLTENGFVGDSVQYKSHGGPERAVLFYCADHYEKWGAEYNKQFIIPGFGENITIKGLSEEIVKIGDVLKIGETIVQISQPRIPCSNLSNYNEENSLLKRLVETGYTGYLGRVLKEGWIDEQTSIELVESPEQSMTILEANHIFFHDKKNKERMEQLLAIPTLAKEWQDHIRKRLDKL
ncbi:MOSC domain-containing protein [Bacillus sp. HMF5848]|uniref:MOSC domain-containing protein n=1 Tax=Bacillus sp. HMF5848 TaxID=2495421 RepID=UPI000F766FDF|nr:MOSC domain-containing protein [Bacillus sp. HMF5848]RSK28203.1 MOSC domain-containing protein [Bacillus sp. HMF5848]